MRVNEFDTLIRSSINHSITENNEIYETNVLGHERSAVRRVTCNAMH